MWFAVTVFFFRIDAVFFDPCHLGMFINRKLRGQRIQKQKGMKLGLSLHLEGGPGIFSADAAGNSQRQESVFFLIQLFHALWSVGVKKSGKLFKKAGDGKLPDQIFIGQNAAPVAFRIIFCPNKAFFCKQPVVNESVL